MHSELLLHCCTLLELSSGSLINLRQNCHKLAANERTHNILVRVIVVIVSIKHVREISIKPVEDICKCI